MMIEVQFLGPIKKPNLNIQAYSLKELKEILKKNKDLEPWLEFCAVAVNEKMVNSLSVELKDGDRVALLPPVCGG